MSSNERVFESTRIISEDEVPPDIREKILQLEALHASEVSKTINVGGKVNVGAMMSAARPKLDTSPDKPLDQRGSALASKLINIAKAVEEKRAERIRDKSKSIVNKVAVALKRDADENVSV